MRRRNFIKAITVLTAWPLAARAQQPGDRVRRIGVLMAHPEGDPEFQAHVAAFREGLRKLGWAEGHNIRIDIRWGALEDAELRQRAAKELVALQPDVILTLICTIALLAAWRFLSDQSRT
jgi:putative ABC transport system substrate-binding protein